MSRARVLRGCEPSDSGATRQTDAGAPGSQTGRASPSPPRVQRPRQPHLTSRAAPGPERGPVYTQLTKRHSVPCAGQRAGGDSLCEHGGQSQLRRNPEAWGWVGRGEEGWRWDCVRRAFLLLIRTAVQQKLRHCPKAVTLQVKTSKC